MRCNTAKIMTSSVYQPIIFLPSVNMFFSKIGNSVAPFEVSLSELCEDSQLWSIEHLFYNCLLNIFRKKRVNIDLRSLTKVPDFMSICC